MKIETSTTNNSKAVNTKTIEEDIKVAAEVIANLFIQQILNKKSTNSETNKGTKNG